MDNDGISWDDIPKVTGDELEQDADMLISYFNKSSGEQENARVLYEYFKKSLEKRDEFKMVSANSSSALAIKSDGTLWSWGNNSYGQLGNGSSDTIVLTPTRIGTDTDWEEVTGGESYSLAIKSDGTLWSWGNNDSGQLGNGSSGTNVLTPTKVGTDNDWKAISAGTFHSLALKTDGTLWSWGNNSSGKLGIGSSGTNVLTPTKVGTDNDWEAISADSSHSLALKTDGTLWAWGNNDYGQLGNGSRGTNVLTPTKVGTDNDWKAISAGTSHSLALKTDGTLWSWGNNSSGKLGIGSSGTNVLTPTKVGTDNDWKAISAGTFHSLALKTDGTLWAWGDNDYGQLGNGSRGTNVLTPTKVGTDNDWKAISTSYGHSLALKTDKTLWSWGNNGSGQLGRLGDNTIPMEVPIMLQIGDGGTGRYDGYAQGIVRENTYYIQNTNYTTGAITAPAGGTWAYYWILRINTPSQYANLIYNQYSGIAPGGAILVNKSNDGYICQLTLFAYRIS